MIVTSAVLLRSVPKIQRQVTRRFLRAAADVGASSYFSGGDAAPLRTSHQIELSNHLNTATCIPSSVRSFHGSAVIQAQRRRRRGGGSPDIGGGGGGDEQSHAARPIPIKDEEKFLSAAKKELDRVESAVEPMKSCNDVFDVTRSTSDEGPQLSIRLRAADATYTLQIDERNFTMTLSSPMSGVYTYVLCSKTNEWLGMDDGHIMEGMLTRDLIRQCNGMPKF